MFLFLIILLTAGSVLCIAPDGLRQMNLLQARMSTLARNGLREGASASHRMIQRAKDLGREISSSKPREQAAREIFSALSVLRNQATASAGDLASSVTTDTLLEQFAQGEGVLQRTYQGTLRLLRTGRSEEAADFFTKSAGISLARDFIMLVLEWDEIPPERLLGTIAAFRNAMKETRTTELLRKNEILSDVVYIPVITGVLIVFVNFIYVAYFADQSEMLTQLFY
ncbi:hypothetical protein AGMMS49983_08150 [Clostridia bacterium]|nr:hypothetical protein AGMMS49983_08150 [Clostridia bacterium]